MTYKSSYHVPGLPEAHLVVEFHNKALHDLWFDGVTHLVAYSNAIESQPQAFHAGMKRHFVEQAKVFAKHWKSASTPLNIKMLCNQMERDLGVPTTRWSEI